MNPSDDYYWILGVIDNAEPAVVKAAYRALVQLYHPDTNPSLDAQEKIRQINEAYSVLSDAKKRKEYDASRSQSANRTGKSEFDTERPFATDSIEAAWNIAAGFYPAIERNYVYLCRISWRLGFAYKLKILEEKSYESANEIAIKMKTDFLRPHFGKDSAVLRYAENLIVCKFVEAAVYLGQLVQVMGGSVGVHRLSEAIDKQFPLVNMQLRKNEMYSRIQYSIHDFSAAQELVRLLGGEVKTTFFSWEVTMVMNGEQIVFSDGPALCRYLNDKYATDCELIYL